MSGMLWCVVGMTSGGNRRRRRRNQDRGCLLDKRSPGPAPDLPSLLQALLCVRSCINLPTIPETSQRNLQNQTESRLKPGSCPYIVPCPSPIPRAEQQAWRRPGRAKRTDLQGAHESQLESGFNTQKPHIGPFCQRRPQTVSGHERVQKTPRATTVSHFVCPDVQRPRRFHISPAQKPKSDRSEEAIPATPLMPRREREIFLQNARAGFEKEPGHAPHTGWGMSLFNPQKRPK